MFRVQFLGWLGEDQDKILQKCNSEPKMTVHFKEALLVCLIAASNWHIVIAIEQGTTVRAQLATGIFFGIHALVIAIKTQKPPNESCIYTNDKM